MRLSIRDVDCMFTGNVNIINNNEPTIMLSLTPTGLYS